MSLKVHWYLVQ